MQIIVKTQATYMCGACKCGLYLINGPREEMTSGIVIVKCVNAECKNKGKIVKIRPQIIEVEPESCVQQEAGKV